MFEQSLDKIYITTILIFSSLKRVKERNLEMRKRQGNEKETEKWERDKEMRNRQRNEKTTE